MKKIFLLCLTSLSILTSFGQLNTGASKIVEQISSQDSLSLSNLEEYITKETINGKLDFNKFLESEKSVLFLYNGIAYNKKDFAILLWGRKVNLLGISSSEKAIKLWEQINNREMTTPEKKALQKGFEIKL